MYKVDTMSNLLNNLKSAAPLSQDKKDIEIYIEKSDAGLIIKSQLEKLNLLMAKHSTVNSLKDVLTIKFDNAFKETTFLKETNKQLEEELKRT